MASGVEQFGRFLGVGAVNALIGLSVIFAAKWFFGASDITANLAGYTVGILISFTANRRWTFDSASAWKPAFVKFVAVSGVAYGANLLAVLAAIHWLGFNGYLAQIVGIPVYTLITFLASKHLVFLADTRAGGVQ